MSIRSPEGQDGYPVVFLMMPGQHTIAHGFVNDTLAASRVLPA
ncbi:MAG TPA: hypothetical protein PLG99_07175 [Kaistiaceae bacterium]|nr:hypothetical protein [Kaistiaceae bacterium]